MEYELRKNPTHLVGTEELAEFLSVGTQWVYDQIALGRIPYYKVGKYLRFDPDEVLRLYRIEGCPE